MEKMARILLVICISIALAANAISDTQPEAEDVSHYEEDPGSFNSNLTAEHQTVGEDDANNITKSDQSKEQALEDQKADSATESVPKIDHGFYGQSIPLSEEKDSLTNHEPEIYDDHVTGLSGVTGLEGIDSLNPNDSILPEEMGTFQQESDTTDVMDLEDVNNVKGENSLSSGEEKTMNENIIGSQSDKEYLHEVSPKHGYLGLFKSIPRLFGKENENSLLGENESHAIHLGGSSQEKTSQNENDGNETEQSTSLESTEEEPLESKDTEKSLDFGNVENKYEMANRGVHRTRSFYNHKNFERPEDMSVGSNEPKRMVTVENYRKYSPIIFITDDKVDPIELESELESSQHTRKPAFDTNESIERYSNKIHRLIDRKFEDSSEHKFPHPIKNRNFVEKDKTLNVNLNINIPKVPSLEMLRLLRQIGTSGRNVPKKEGCTTDKGTSLSKYNPSEHLNKYPWPSQFPYHSRSSSIPKHVMPADSSRKHERDPFEGETEDKDNFQQNFIKNKRRRIILADQYSKEKSHPFAKSLQDGKQGLSSLIDHFSGSMTPPNKVYLHPSEGNPLSVDVDEGLTEDSDYFPGTSVDSNESDHDISVAEGLDKYPRLSNYISDLGQETSPQFSNYIVHNENKQNVHKLLDGNQGKYLHPMHFRPSSRRYREENDFSEIVTPDIKTEKDNERSLSDLYKKTIKDLNIKKNRYPNYVNLLDKKKFKDYAVNRFANINSKGIHGITPGYANDLAEKKEYYSFLPMIPEVWSKKDNTNLWQYTLPETTDIFKIDSDRTLPEESEGISHGSSNYRIIQEQDDTVDEKPRIIQLPEGSFVFDKAPRFKLDEEPIEIQHILERNTNNPIDTQDEFEAEVPRENQFVLEGNNDDAVETQNKFEIEEPFDLTEYEVPPTKNSRGVYDNPEYFYEQLEVLPDEKEDEELNLDDIDMDRDGNWELSNTSSENNAGLLEPAEDFNAIYIDSFQSPKEEEEGNGEEQEVLEQNFENLSKDPFGINQKIQPSFKHVTYRTSSEIEDRDLKEKETYADLRNPSDESDYYQFRSSRYYLPGTHSYSLVDSKRLFTEPEEEGNERSKTERQNQIFEGEIPYDTQMPLLKDGESNILQLITEKDKDKLAEQLNLSEENYGDVAFDETEVPSMDVNGKYAFERNSDSSKFSFNPHIVTEGSHGITDNTQRMAGTEQNYDTFTENDKDELLKPLVLPELRNGEVNFDRTVLPSMEKYVKYSYEPSFAEGEFWSYPQKVSKESHGRIDYSPSITKAGKGHETFPENDNDEQEENLNLPDEEVAFEKTEKPYITETEKYPHGLSSFLRKLELHPYMVSKGSNGRIGKSRHLKQTMPLMKESAKYPYDSSFTSSKFWFYPGDLSKEKHGGIDNSQNMAETEKDYEFITKKDKSKSFKTSDLEKQNYEGVSFEKSERPFTKSYVQYQYDPSFILGKFGFNQHVIPGGKLGRIDNSQNMAETGKDYEFATDANKDKQLETLDLKQQNYEDGSFEKPERSSTKANVKYQYDPSFVLGKFGFNQHVIPGGSHGRIDNLKKIAETGEDNEFATETDKNRKLESLDLKEQNYGDVAFKKAERPSLKKTAKNLYDKNLGTHKLGFPPYLKSEEGHQRMDSSERMAGTGKEYGTFTREISASKPKILSKEKTEVEPFTSSEYSDNGHTSGKKGKKSALELLKIKHWENGRKYKEGIHGRIDNSKRLAKLGEKYDRFARDRSTLEPWPLSLEKTEVEPYTSFEYSGEKDDGSRSGKKGRKSAWELLKIKHWENGRKYKEGIRGRIDNSKRLAELGEKYDIFTRGKSTLEPWPLSLKKTEVEPITSFEYSGEKDDGSTSGKKGEKSAFELLKYSRWRQHLKDKHPSLRSHFEPSNGHLEAGLRIK